MNHNPDPNVLNYYSGGILWCKWHRGIHHKFSCYIIGIETKADCTVQLKSPSLGSRPSDGLFAVLDGGRSTDAPAVVRKTLESTMLEEMVDEERMLKRGSVAKEKLQYLVHTFLSAHRCTAS